ncbi:WD40 repeat-like protein [Suillus weaverae]|nr:WD40 repeat-like protein [Suillus weaverae]
MSQLIPSTIPLRTFEDHEKTVRAVAVFPDKRRMVTGSDDKTLRLWDLKTGVVLKKMEGHSSAVWKLAVSRDGQIIVSGDDGGGVIVWYGETGEPLTQPIKAHDYYVCSLGFSPDGTVLATAGAEGTMKFWCTKTWEMQGEAIECRGRPTCIGYSPSGELLAITTNLNIEIYNTSTRERVAFFAGDYNSSHRSLAWILDGTRLLTGDDPTIKEWDPLTWEQVDRTWKGPTSVIRALAINPAGTLVASASDHIRLWRLSDRRTIAIFKPYDTTCITFSADGKHILSGGMDNKISEWAVPSDAKSKILAITTARNACLTGDLSTAEELLTQEIVTDPNEYTSYANRSFVMARKHNWDHALDDAIKSITIKPSLTGYISKGIALCGKGQVREARIAFDVASILTNQNSIINHFLLLIKAIALFNTAQHEEAMLLIKELAACPNTDLLGCRVVETYLRVELGTKALGDARHDEAANYFTTAVNSSAFSSKFIPQVYEDLIILFGWDLESLYLNGHQKRCQAFLSAGKPDEALEAHKYMMDAIDESAKASCLDWSNEFKEQCSALAAHDDRILGAEIPGQDQDGYDAEPNFFRGMQERSQISRPQPQQRPGHLKRLKLAMTRAPRSAPPPVPPTTPLPVAVVNTLRTHLQHLFTRPPHHPTLPVVEVPFAKGKERNVAAGAAGNNPDIVPYEDQDLDTQPDPNSRQQQQAVAVHVDPGEHGGRKSCICC